MIAAAMLLQVTFSLAGWSEREQPLVEQAVSDVSIHLPVVAHIAGVTLPLPNARNVRIIPHRWCKQMNHPKYRITVDGLTDSREPNTIFLCDPWFAKPRSEREVILAHELVHIFGPRDIDFGPSHQEGSAELTRIVRRALRGEDVRHTRNKR